MDELAEQPSPKELSFTDKYLTVWILGAIILGVVIGYLSPSSADNIDSWSTGNVNWPIAVGLIVMMFPPLARVNYDNFYLLMVRQFTYQHQIESIVELATFLSHSEPKCGPKCVCHDDSSNGLISRSKDRSAGNFKGLMVWSLVLNWLIGPLLMFFLAIACLPDNVPYIRGLILIGLARCIAMVIVWNDLASGSNEYCAVLVSLNSVFQILTYSPLAYILISLFLPVFNLGSDSQNRVSVSFGLVAESVAIYLGIPFAMGIGFWLIFNKVLGGDWAKWYKIVFIRYTSPLTLIALLFTIIVMFCLKGRVIVSIPLDVLRIAVPLCLYFTIMFVGTYYICHLFRFNTQESITLSFTSASNNFELAIAVSIAVFGLNSPEAFAGVIGPLVEVPVMLGFVYLVRYLEKLWPTVTPKPVYSSLNDKEEVPRNVLFFCVGNSCRSQMALGWCQYYHRDSFVAYSAGVEPKPDFPGAINPRAVQVMLENGVDISGFHSKNVEDLAHVPVDVVVTVCDAVCPRYRDTGSSAIVLHHSFDDPSALEALLPEGTAEEDVLNVYRRVCNEIKLFVRDDLELLIESVYRNEQDKIVCNVEDYI
jgi:ACR3 family arsenite transporter